MMRAAAGQVAAFFMSLSVLLLLLVESGAADSSTAECTKVVENTRSCLPYASAQTTTPTAECCKMFNSTLVSNKDCLCRFIELVHQGSPQVNSLGIQYAKLIKLPSACKLNNVSASDCAKLAPSSSPSASNETSAGNVGYKLQVALRLEVVVLVAMVAFLFPFPSRLLSHVFV